MGEHVEKTLETITRVEALLISRHAAETCAELARRDLLYQIGETKRVLHGFKPGVEARHPVRRELHRAVVQMEAMVRNWWNSNDRGAKWLEHFLGSLLDLRWWTMVAASQEGEDIMSVDISMFRIKHKGASSHHRHFSSSASEQTEEGRSIFRQDGDLANMMKLEEFLPERLTCYSYIVEGETFVSEAASPLISEELTLDLCQDVLGVSRTGSWVIRTMYQEVDCALKRVTCDCQPVLARLSHPHIVQLLHYWRKEKYLFLMMELMDGDLTDVLKRSLVSLPVAVDILLQTAKAMLYLHDWDVSYPSLSCSNILFRDEKLLQDGHMEYTIKLAGGGYDSTKSDFKHGKTRDLHRFGTLCLEVLTGRPQREDLLDDLVLDIPEGIPQGLRSCITSCFEDNRSFGFEQVVTLLLLAKFQVLKGEAVGSQGCETVQPGLDRAAGASAADADFQEYPLYQLYPEQDVSDLSTTLIFFHGFAKSPDEYKSTWMTRNREHVWPEAWLPKDLPQGNLRILSLSYDTEASSDDRDVGAIELAKKVLRQLLSSKWNLADPESKVVLIGHSFGGLIIKRLVVEAHNQANGPSAIYARCSQFLRNLEYIVFYGVPGSATDQSQQYEEYITKLNETSVLRRSSLLEALLKDRRLFDTEMQILGLDFEHRVPEKTRILHFIEGKGMKKILGKQIVSDASARAQPKNVIFHELKEDNHFEVCRPVSKDHEGYKILVEVLLKDMVLGSCQSERDKGKRRKTYDTVAKQKDNIYGRPDGARGNPVLNDYGGGQIVQHISSLEHDEVKHKIFISHSGAQKDFAEQLCKDLERHGSLCPFFDQRHHSLPKGKDFAPLIKEAARDCLVAVIVLSKEFLSSKWPMIELAEFHGAQEAGNRRLKMLPLFYKLSAKDLDEGSIKELWMPAWRQLANGDERISVEKWSAAVRALRKVNGVVFGQKGASEVAYRKEIVQSIFESSPSDLVYGSSHEMVGYGRIFQFDGAGGSKSDIGRSQREELARGGISGKFLKEGDAEHNAPDTITPPSVEPVEARIEEVVPVQEILEDDLIQRGREVFFQAFNWESCKQKWWNLLASRVDELAKWGFTSFWLPPAWDSLAPQGYLPRDLYSLNTQYGSEGELRTLLRKINETRGVRAMADIVINHRIGSVQGYGGRYNRYDGMPMPWDEHAVTSDTGGLGNPKTGVIFEGVPNLDHTQDFVRSDLKNWMNWVRNDLGFTDFRFDFSKGYASRFVREFIDAAHPFISVGEYWDSCRYVGPDYALDYNQDAHRQRTVNWIDGNQGAACAFDFTTKAILQEAVWKKQWWRLRDGQGRPPGVIGMWSSRAVTFVDNHDTGSSQRFWPFPDDHVVQGYAYILTHPGQPCVFWDHIYDWGDFLRGEILRMIEIRKRNDLHSRSTVEILEANDRVYTAMIDQKVCMKLGDGDWSPHSGEWELAISGQSYAIWQKPQRLLPA